MAYMVVRKGTTMLQQYSSFSGPREAPAQRRVIHLPQAPYLTNNWKTIQANDEYQEYTKYVRVTGGVANITNGKLLVRYYLGVQDGFYVFTEGKTMVEAIPEMRMRMYGGFPDVEAFRPDFPKLDRSNLIKMEEVSAFVGFLNFLREGEIELETNRRVHIEGNSVVDTRDINKRFNFSCEIPVNQEGMIFEVDNLRMAFIELLRYDQIQIGHDNRPEIDAPLVMGKDWGHCVLLGAEQLNKGYRYHG